MAIRTNYVEYSFLQITGSVLGSNTVAAFQPVFMAVPETGSREWKSVWVQFTARDMQTTATSLTTARLSLSMSNLSGSHTAAPQHNFTWTIANTGEQQSHALSADYTSFFNTNFTTLLPFRHIFLSGTMVGPSYQDLTAKICATYTYDDTAQTQRVKHVKIPLDSINNPYRSTLQEIGGTGAWSVPLLHEFCPEGSKIWRDVNFEFWGNETVTSTTNCALSLSLDAETPVMDTSHTQNLNSSCWYTRMWNRTGNMSTTQAHRLFIGSHPASRFNCMGGVLGVTYEYDTTTTSQSLNSVWMPLPAYGGTIGYWGSFSSNVPRRDDYSTRQLKIWVEEPNPVLVNSGVVAHWWDIGGQGRLGVAVNNALTRSFDAKGSSTPSGTLRCGGQTIVHRFDSGSISGSMSLARGENTISVKFLLVDVQLGGPGPGYNTSGMVILNYRSDVASGGIATHNHTVGYNWLQPATTIPCYVRDFSGYDVHEPRYWVNNVGFEYNVYYPANSCSIALEVNPSTPDEVSGWRSVGVTQVGTATGTSEIGLCPTYMDATSLFRQHPQDQWTYPRKMFVTSSKQFSMDVSDRATPWIHPVWGNTWITWHSIVTMISGAVYNWSDGDGGGIGVEVYRDKDKTMCVSMSTATGGTFSEVWYDDVEPYYCVAIPNSRSMGRSRAALPS